MGKNERAYVAWSVRNRVNSKKWSNTYEGVIMQYNKKKDVYQYSAVKHNWHDYKDLSGAGKRVFENVRQIAKEVFTADSSTDPTNGADHYYSPYIPTPDWTTNMTYLEHLEDNITRITTRYKGVEHKNIRAFKFYRSK